MLVSCWYWFTWTHLRGNARSSETSYRAAKRHAPTPTAVRLGISVVQLSSECFWSGASDGFEDRRRDGRLAALLKFVTTPVCRGNLTTIFTHVSMADTGFWEWAFVKGFGMDRSTVPQWGFGKAAVAGLTGNWIPRNWHSASYTTHYSYVLWNKAKQYFGQRGVRVNSTEI